MERLILSEAVQTSATRTVYQEITNGFNFSITGAWSGAITLEGNFGDGEFVTIATYTENTADYGFLATAALALRLRTSDTFSGEARALISQTGMIA